MDIIYDWRNRLFHHNPPNYVKNIEQKFQHINASDTSVNAFGFSAEVFNLVTGKATSFDDRLHDWISSVEVDMTEWRPVPEWSESADQDLFAAHLQKSIVKDQYFTDCISGLSKTLVLQGKPGVGKTTTAQGIIDHVRIKRQLPVAGAFFHHDVPNMHNAAKILAVLLKQLIRPSNEGATFITRLFRGFRKLTQKRSDISAALRDAILNTGAVCLVVDALDECSKLTELNDLLGDLEKIQQETGVGLILTERPGQVASQQYFDNDGLHYRIQHVQARDEDISEYILARIKRHARWLLGSQHSAIVSEMQKKVAFAARGIFFLVKIFMDRLCRTQRLIHLKRELQYLTALCKSFHSTDTGEYTDYVLEKAIRGELMEAVQTQLGPDESRAMNVHEGKSANTVFRFVRDAARPLSVMELRYALAFNGLGTWPTAEDTLGWEDLQGISYGLVESRNDKRGDGTVVFIHTLVAQQFDTVPNRARFPDANVEMALACVACLGAINVPSDLQGTRQAHTDLARGHPFLVYAARHWSSHFKKAMSESSECTTPTTNRAFAHLSGQVEALLMDPKKVELTWQLLQEEDKIDTDLLERMDTTDAERWTSITWGDDTSPLQVSDASGASEATGLHLACEHGFQQLVKALLERNVSKNHQDFRGRTPLWIAAKAGFIRIVDQLILANADINRADNCGVTPLHAAAAHGHIEIVKALLRQKGSGRVRTNVSTSNINMTRLYRWDFQQPPKNSKIQRPIDDGTSSNSSTVNLQGESSDNLIHSVWGRTALHAAARKGHVDIVRALLSNAETATATRDSEGMTAFHKAAKYGHVDVAKEMMRNKSFRADAKVQVPTKGSTARISQSREGCNALHLASSEGHIKMMEFLVNLPDQLCNMTDDKGRAPLHYAAWYSRADAIQCLLSLDELNVHLRDEEGNSALTMALRGVQLGRAETFRLIWDRFEEKHAPRWAERPNLENLARERRCSEVLSLLKGCTSDPDDWEVLPTSSTVSRTVLRQKLASTGAYYEHREMGDHDHSDSQLGAHCEYPRSTNSRPSTPTPELMKGTEGSVMVRSICAEDEAMEESMAASIVLRIRGSGIPSRRSTGL